MRRLLRKRHFERIWFSGDLLLSLKEYPVTEVLALYAIQREPGNGELIEPEFFSVIPDCGIDNDLPFTLSLSPAVMRLRHIEAFRVVYWAGYAPANFARAKLAAGKAPADLASACLELASWNMGRYRGRHIGMTGSVRGQGKEGEHFEQSMPQNVKALLEPYRRRVI
jgi:hypothetical protein